MTDEAAPTMTSQIISADPSTPARVPLVKASKQIQEVQRTTLIDGAIERPYAPGDLKNTLTQSVWHNRAIQFKATCSVGLGFVVTPKGSDEPYEEEKLRELYPWLFQANEDETFLEIATEMVMDREAIGDGWWEVERNQGGKIANLYHARGESIWLEQDKKERNRIIGYIQRTRAGGTKHFRRFGETKGLEGEDVTGGRPGELIRFKNPMIGDPWYGIPDYIPAIRAIALGMSVHDYNFDFFSNGGIPAWMMNVKGGSLGEVALANTLTFFRQNFSPSQHGAFKLLLNQWDDKDMEIEMKRVTAEIEDMSFPNLADRTRDEILAADGVPGRVLGIATPQKLGGGGDIQADLKSFKEITVRPKQKLIEEKIDTTLLAESGDKIKFNELDLAPEAPEEADDTESALEEEETAANNLIKGLERLRKKAINGDFDTLED